MLQSVHFLSISRFVAAQWQPQTLHLLLLQLPWMHTAHDYLTEEPKAYELFVGLIFGKHLFPTMLAKELACIVFEHASTAAMLRSHLHIALGPVGSVCNDCFVLV